MRMRKSGVIQDEIKALENKIIEIGGSRLLSQKSKVDGLRLHIKLANEELTKAEFSKSKAEKDLKKHQGNIEGYTTELEEAEEELAGLETQLEEVAELMSELKNKVDVANAAEEEWSEKLASMKEQVEEMSEGVQGFRQREVRELARFTLPRCLIKLFIQVKLKQDIGDAKKKYNENKATMDHWMAEHDKLELEDVE